MKELQSKYADMFKPELGTVKGTKATLHLRKNVKPVFCKARSVPFALRPAVERELERMQSEGIIMPVEFSEWATPLVCVPKPDGTVRLCGDYRTMVNQATHTVQFPIPMVEEIRSRLAGGEKFTKIDLKCAYQPMLLDEKAQELCTINTHKGLFRYSRLPFGVLSSPAIWQRFMEQALSGMTSICVMVDDVLITGRDDRTHAKFRGSVSEVPKVWLAPEEGEMRLLATFSQVLWLMYIQGGSKYYEEETGSNPQCSTSQ